MSSFFDHVHLTITIRVHVEDAMHNGIIDQILTRLCPIAAMFAECGTFTAECHIIRN